jgi:SAM-dependent methyltransferase
LDIGSGHGRIVSYLVEKGYEVTAVEFNEEFVTELRARFPGVKVIAEDVRNIDFDAKFDVVTCIELAQNLERKDLSELLAKLAGITRLLLINISNRNSLHAHWLRFRHFGNPFVFAYTPAEFEQALEQAGFDIIHRRGIGLITPISLFKNFKGKLIPVWLARVANKLDALAPKMCHLYYIEAKRK